MAAPVSSPRLRVEPGEDAVVVGSSDGFWIRRFDLGGRLRQEILAPGRVAAVAPDELDSLRDDYLRERRDDPEMAAGPDFLPLFERDVQPEHRPGFGRMVVGPRGWVWVGDYVPRGSVPPRWTAFAPDGHLVGTVAGLLPGAEPLWLGDSTVVLRVTGALGVEHVEVRTLGWTEGPR